MSQPDARRARPTSGGRTVPRRAARRRLPMSAAAVAALALFAAFVLLAAFSGPHSGLSAWDARVTEAFTSWRTAGRSHLFWVMTLLGNDPVLAALSASAVILLAAWGRRARAALVGVGLLIGWGISEAAKTAVGRARPPAAGALIGLPSSHSMPSGHALTTSVFIGLLVYVAWRAWWVGGGPVHFTGRAETAPSRLGGAGLWVAFAAVAGLAFAGLIGVSRVYLGVHWLSDVIGGWCLGTAWLAAYLGVLWPAARRRWAEADRAAPSGSFWARLSRFLARRPPVRGWVLAAAVVFAVILCVLGLVLGALSDRLVANV